MKIISLYTISIHVNLFLRSILLFFRSVDKDDDFSIIFISGKSVCIKNFKFYMSSQPWMRKLPEGPYTPGR